MIHGDMIMKFKSSLPFNVNMKSFTQFRDLLLVGYSAISPRHLFSPAPGTCVLHLQPVACGHHGLPNCTETGHSSQHTKISLN